MKKFIPMMVLVFSMLAGSSQSTENIRKMINDKKFADAKTAIDKFMADPKNANSAEGWYLKGRTYNAVSDEASTPLADKYQLKVDAYEALKKSQQLDPKETMMKLEQYISYLSLYYGLYDVGAGFFNDKNFNSSFESFKKALEVEDYIKAKGYTYDQAKFPAFDTSLITNIAIAANQAKNKTEAVNYYRKITDAGIGGESARDAYEFLVDYYNRADDAANLNALLVKAKALYPTYNYWNEVELDRIQKSGDEQALFAKYESMLEKDPNNFPLAYNYSVELYNKVWGKGASEKTADAATKAKLVSALQKAIAADQGIDATMLMTNHLYNEASDLTNAAASIKGSKPEDVKKKAAIKAEGNKKMDETISYADKVVAYYEPKVAELKPGQMANYKIVLSYLADIYGLKGDAKKAAEYEKKKAALK